MVHLIQQAILLLQTGTEISLFSQAVEALRSVGPFGLIILFVYGLYKRWWVMGNEFRALETRAVKFEELALSGANIAEHAAAVAEATISRTQSMRRPKTARTRAEDE